jgi:ATP:corrinoid adenosyltransferase
LGDRDDVGERSMAEAADALRGVAAVYIARVPVDAAGKGDLADVARGGAAALRAALAAAELLHPAPAAPIDLRDPLAGAAILAALEAALEQAAPDKVGLVIVPPGAGKTTAAFRLAARIAEGGGRVAIALPAHVNAAEKLAEFAAASPGVLAAHVRGMAAQCQLQGEAVARAAATMGRAMCAGCPLATRAGGTCEGWIAPVVRPGEVTFATHAAAPSLASTMGPGDLVILDELPHQVDAQTTGAAALATVRSGALSVRRWYRAHPGHGELAAALIAVADELAETEARDDTHAIRVSLARVLDALRMKPDALDAAADVIAELARDPSSKPPMPSPADARRGAADRWPTATAVGLVRAVARALVAPPGATPGADLTCLRLDADGWAFEARRLYELPAGVRVLALDATGEIARAEWSALAARSGRTLATAALTVTGAAPAAADHYRTGRLRTGRLWHRHGRGVVFSADAPGAVRNALGRAAGAAPCTVGILSHKPLADACRWGLRLAADAAAAPPEGAAFEFDDVHARAVADEIAELVKRGWRFELGHFGRDDRSSNAFQSVDVLAVMGSPRPDCGAVAEDARALGIDPDSLARDRTLAATVQSLARARHVRRMGVRLFLASDCEAPTGAALPGVVWAVEIADRSHAPTVRALDAAHEIARWADAAGFLDVPACRLALAPMGIGWRLSARLCREEAARRQWVGTEIGKGGRLVYHCGAVGTLTAHGGGASPSPLPLALPLPTVPLLLDPMSGKRGLPGGVAPVHDLADARNRPPSRPSLDPPGWFAELPPVAEYDGPPLDDDDDGSPGWLRWAAG